MTMLVDSDKPFVKTHFIIKELLTNKNRDFLNMSQILLRMQSEWNFPMLLVGVQNGRLLRWLSRVKNLPEMWEFWVQSLGGENCLGQTVISHRNQCIHLLRNPSETSSRKIMKDEKSQYSEKVFHVCEFLLLLTTSELSFD